VSDYVVDDQGSNPGRELLNYSALYSMSIKEYFFGDKVDRVKLTITSTQG
jgi:hypothetical protein